jgi:hypothetical protein
MVGLLFLYLGVFVVLVTVQFAKERGFTLYIGPMTVSGHYKEPAVQAAGPDDEVPAGGRSLEGGVTVSFGGMEFRLQDDGEFALLRSGGDKVGLLPEAMLVSGASAAFDFEDGTRLIFDTFDAGSGGPEFRITCQFGEEYMGLELPYRPLRSSRIQDAGSGQFVIMAGGIPYSFGRSRLDGSRRVLILDIDDAIANYRAVPVQREFVPADYVLAAARDEARYTALVNLWRDSLYSLWSGAVRNTVDESLIIAFAGESVNRGAYQQALSEISPVFLQESSWTYAAAVYLGRLDLGLRSLSAFETAAFAHFSALIAAKSPDLFRESHVIAYSGKRGYGPLLDGIAGLARSLDPAFLSPALIPGILEAHAEWKTYRSQGDNPFEGLIEGALFSISEGIRRNAAGDQVFYFGEAGADTEYNLRLGLALDQYGRQSGQGNWAALGRSLVISVLSLTENGSLPGTLGISVPPEAESGNDAPDAVIQASGTARIDNLALYPYFPADTYPHAVGIGAPVNGIWAWTASASVTASQGNNILDIAVAFPTGEAHYMLIRGLRPFVKIQLYGIDYRTDPQFERYDSSGWSYSSSEQTLLLKLKHRAPVEHIRIFY